MRFFGLCCTVGLLGLILSGCGGGSGGLLPVKGTVTLDDKPLAGATVTFQPLEAGGSPSYGQTDASGSYTLEFAAGKPGAMPGKHQVRISKSVDDGVSTEKSPEVKGKTRRVARETVPAKYNRETTLEVTVEEGKKVYNFDLESD